MIPHHRPEEGNGAPHGAPDSPVLGPGDEGHSRHKAATQLRRTIDDFLDHLRYVGRQEWNEFRQEELVLAQNRYDWFTEELWRLVLQDKHPQHCDCDVCMRLRVDEDR
jgi:hypothetical protein